MCKHMCKHNYMKMKRQINNNINNIENSNNMKYPSWMEAMWEAKFKSKWWFSFILPSSCLFLSLSFVPFILESPSLCAMVKRFNEEMNILECLYHENVLEYLPMPLLFRGGLPQRWTRGTSCGSGGVWTRGGPGRLKLDSLSHSTPNKPPQQEFCLPRWCK